MVFKKTSKRGGSRTNIPNPKPKTPSTLIPSPTPTSAIVRSPTAPPSLAAASAPPQSTPTTTFSSSGLNPDDWRQQISYAPFPRPCQSSNGLFQKRLPSSWMHPAPTPHACTSLKNCPTTMQAAQNPNYVQQSLPQTWNTPIVLKRRRHPTSHNNRSAICSTPKKHGGHRDNAGRRINKNSIPPPKCKVPNNRPPITFARSIPTPKAKVEPTWYSKIYHNISISNSDDMNMTEDDLRLWKKYHDRQRKVSETPLFDGLCYKCGELLFSKVKGHFYKKNKNQDQIAPITQKFTTLPDIPHETPDKKQWYCCRRCFDDKPECPSYAEPATGCADMPTELAALPTAIARRAISLCSIFTSTFRKRDAHRHQWRHIRGGVNIWHKSNRHYYGMFGYFTTRATPDHNLTPVQRTIKKFIAVVACEQSFVSRFLLELRNIVSLVH